MDKLEKDILAKSRSKDWTTKLLEYLQHSGSASMVKFDAEEQIHYLDRNDVNQLKIPFEPEQRYMNRLYTQIFTEQRKEQVTRLQPPNITFGEDYKSKFCKRCKKGECTMQKLQKRSADEPTSFYYQCKQCKYGWKDSS